MRKAIAIAVLAGLIGGAFAVAPASAKKKKKAPARVERVAESEYMAPALGTYGAGVCLYATNSCGETPTATSERWVKVEITDATGRPVPFSLAQDTDEDAPGSEVDMGDYCGTTGDTAIMITAPGTPIIAFPWSAGTETCPGPATTGTIKMTISNRP